MYELPFTVIVTVVAVFVTFMFSGRVGGMRGKDVVVAPATTGDSTFEKAFRVHYNTIEQLVIFLPVLWLAAHVVGDLYAAGIGAVWIIGRLVYSKAYMENPSKRVTGMMLTMLPTGVLLLITLWGLFKTFTG